ncbi:Crp/Fnr family transcriptional regulator [Methylobacterium sp. V23]|uniref:Crp/Fnr family transcriptional regulator n=1 Tax=Methylobacterium sp. V23 TaxID=2044878 RepID=UPI001FE07683|nr:Crp/Fnr family transcriptional regulator [Methylobacterium sp. V23]
MLAALAPADLALLEPHLELVTLALGEMVIAPDEPITHVHFIQQGIVSCIGVATDGERIEFAVVGREGLVGLPLLMGADRTPDEGLVQMSGLAWAIPKDAFLGAMRSSPCLHGHLLRYAQAHHVLVASTALANGRYKVDARLARWLLMCHDRVDGDVLPTTHQFLSLMLGVDRSGLTTIVRRFVREGLIESRRGTITIVDRTRLLMLAGAAYGRPEAEYERLLGQEPTSI